MSIDFINEVIITFNQLINDLEDGAVAVSAMSNDDDGTILLGVTDHDKLAASLVFGDYPLFSFSGTNPRDIAERLEDTLDKLSQISTNINKTNSEFDDDTVRGINLAFGAAFRDMTKTEQTSD